MGTTVTSPQQSRQNFERTVEDLQAWANGIIAHLPWDAYVRRQYRIEIAAAVEDIRREVQLGHMNWKQAAMQAQELRGTLMTVLRARSSPIGRAAAEWIKRENRTLNWLIAKYTMRTFGQDAIFEELTEAQKNQVYAELIAGAARSEAEIDSVISRIGRVGHSLVLLSLAASVYEVATSNNPLQTAERETELTAGALAGDVAGGALAGLACGPGAPVCVTMGAFVGGVIAVLGLRLAWR